MSVVSRVEAPCGEVTLMFTHVEGAAALWEKFGEGFQVALEAHNELMRRAISANSGYEVKTISDSFMAAFPEAILAANCAIEMQRLIETESFSGIGGMRVRIGLHTGRLTPQNGDYFGPAVNHAARIESSAHGGQIVLSEQTCNLIATRLSIDSKLQDTGLHRLKDLASPIRLFTLTRSDLPERGYPPLRTLDAFPHNFPGQATSFVGRESEIVELSDLLVKRKTRLVTIIGPGGTGKTRLAMQVGADCIDFFPDGVWMIDLVNTSNARDVPSAVAIALKIELSSADPRGQIVAHLREKRALLIFDNFEHVIEASRFLGGLIKECRNLVCLVTSQHLLQISGEHEYPLSPLELPPDDVTLVAGMRYAGLRLFVERAMTASPHFSLDESSLPAVTAICKRLEGLPLAIELTASLCRAMTPQEILPKLQDRFKLLAGSRRDLDPRQRSLRGALDWSYDLLNEDERKLFSELSVFAGGFSLEALEEVCPIPEALDYVFALRDKSLVRTLEQGNEIRYSMLESIREYARERQREFEEDVSADNEGEPREAIRSRHASYFLRLAQEHSPKLLNAGLELEAARKVIEIDLANMRVGMQFNIEQRNGAEIVNYGIELSRFLQIRSLYSECEEVLNVSEAAARDNGNKSSLALLLNRHGLMATNRSDNEQALRLFQESYDLGKEIDDKRKIMIASINLGNIAWGQSRFNDAEKIWSETLSLSIESGNANNQAMLLGSLGILATWRGEFGKANAFFEESLKLCNQGGSSEQLAGSLFNYAELLARLGDYEGAKQKLKESYSNYKYLGNEYGKLHVDILEGIVLLEENSLDEAKSILQKALTDSTKLGTPRTEMYASLALARVFAKRNEVEKARSLFLKSYEIGMAIADRKHLSDVMIYVAEMHKRVGNPTASFALQARADEEYREMGLKNDVFSQETLKNISQMIETNASRPLSSSDTNERHLLIMRLI